MELQPATIILMTFVAAWVYCALGVGVMLWLDRWASFEFDHVAGDGPYVQGWFFLTWPVGAVRVVWLRVRRPVSVWVER